MTVWFPVLVVHTN